MSFIMPSQIAISLDWLMTANELQFMSRDGAIVVHLNRENEKLLINVAETDAGLIISKQPPQRTQNSFVMKVNELVASHYKDEHFGLPQLCQKMRMSRSQLFRRLKAAINVSPSAYIRKYRLDRARELLSTGQLTIAEVAYCVGFRDPAHFSKVFRDAFKVSPSGYLCR